MGNATTFLVEAIFGLYLLIIMLRLLLQWSRASFYNPVSQFIVKATQPVLKPLRRYIPGFGGIDLAAVLLLVVVQLVELFVITRIIDVPVGFAALLVLTVARLIELLINIFFFAILIRVILSFLNPGAHNPIAELVDSLTEPLLGPARRLIPPMGGFDLSPIPVMLALQLAKILIVAPINDLARTVGG
ncbi:MAG: YggT family protein [Gammaproteobacteria bacterium]